MTSPAAQSAARKTPTQMAPRCFDTLYRQHFPGVWRLLRRLGVSEPQLDDASQDVFLVVHRRLPQWDGRSSRAWVYAIAVRVASDHRRAARRRPVEALPDVLQTATPDPAQESELRQSVELLHQLLAGLEHEQREVFVLSELEQLSAPEIASVLGANLNTIYSRQRAARQRFEAGLQRHRAKLAHRALAAGRSRQ